MPDAVYYAAHKEEHKEKVKAYKAENVERVRTWNRNSARKRRAEDPTIRTRDRMHAKNWALKNPERKRQLFEDFHARNPDYNREYLVQEAKRNPAKRLFQGARTRARDKNLAFELRLEDIIIPEACPVLGIPLIFGLAGRGKSDNSPSLDRLRPELGYVKGNVRVISMRANWVKSNGTIREFERIIEYMRREGCT